jgi:hypothetical protein
MTGPRVLVIACGALAREILDLIERHNLDNFTLECLPARYHNEPDVIPEAVRERIRRSRDHYDEVLVGYADCGTGGRLQKVCSEEQATMLEGAHCYQFFAGSERFLSMHEEQLGTLYLTDFLARHFDRLIWHGFGIAEHPELLDMYFANYTRVMYLAQTANSEFETKARDAAHRLGLAYEKTVTGYGELEPALLQIGAAT